MFYAKIRGSFSGKMLPGQEKSKPVLNLNDRLSKHHEKYYAGKYTSISNDWELYVELVCQSINQSRKVEIHIKRMKSRKYIQDLKSYPEMREKLLLRYKEDN